jgi:hypothetical protein
MFMDEIIFGALFLATSLIAKFHIYSMLNKNGKNP